MEQLKNIAEFVQKMKKIHVLLLFSFVQANVM